MSVAKQLKFQLVLDQASFTQVKNSIQQLVDLTAKLSKNLQGVGGVGGGGLLGNITGGQQQSAARSAVKGAQRTGGVGGLSDVVRQNLDLFKGLGKEGAQSMNILVDALRKATTQSQSELQRQTTHVDKLAAAYERLKKAGSPAADRALGRWVSARAEQEEKSEDFKELSGALKNKTKKFFSKENLFDEERIPFMPKRLQDKIFSKASEFGFMPEGGPTPGMMRGMSLAGGALAIGTAAVSAFKETRAGTRVMNNTMAERGEMVSDRVRALRNLDISAPLARRLADAESKKDLLAQTQGFGASLDAGVANMSSAFSGVKGLLTMQGGGGTGGVGMAYSGVPGESAKFANFLQQQDALVKNYTTQDALMGYEYLQKTAGSRLRTEQIRGRGRMNKVNPVDDYTIRQNQLNSLGLSIDEENSAILQSRGMGMGGRFSGTIMHASAGGYTGVPEAVKNAFVTKGKNALEAVKMGMGATADYTVGLQLSNMANAYNGRNVMDQSGFLASMQSGFSNNNKMTQLDLERLKLGVQSMDQIAAGRSGYEKGTNLIGAIRAGPGLGTYSQDMLANMDTQTLANMAAGHLTDVQKAQGYTSQMAKEVYESRAGNPLRTYVDQKTNSGMDIAVRAWRESKEKNLGKFAKEHPEFQAGLIGAEMAASPGGSMTEEAARGLLMLGDPTGKVKKGGIPGVNTNFSDTNKQLLDAQNKANEQNSKSLTTNLKPILDSLATLVGEEGPLVRFATDLKYEAKDTAASLMLLTQAVDMATYAISKGQIDATSIKAGAKKAEASEAEKRHKEGREPGSAGGRR